MVWILVICVVVLAILCVVLSCRVYKLRQDLRWWRDEAVRLNRELPKRDSKGRFCKREE
jgi:hypothetical protein